MTANVGESTALGRHRAVAEIPPAAKAVRWGVAMAALAILIPLFAIYPPTVSVGYFLMFGAAMVASEFFFSVRIGPGSVFSIASTFLFVYFLIAGAIGAASLAAFAYLVTWIIRRLTHRTSLTISFAGFEIGETILSALSGGAAVQFLFSRPAISLPVYVQPITSLVVFALVYLLTSTVLSSIAVLARAGYSEVRNNLWPTTTLWLAISFVTNIPFAIVMKLIAPPVGYVLATLIILSFLAGIASIVRLNAGLRAGNEELKAVNRIGTLINATLDPSQLYRILARETSRVLRWDVFFVAIGTKASNEIELVFLTDTGAEIAQRSIPAGAGLTGKAIQSGELVFYEQGIKEKDVDEDIYEGRRKPRSIVVAPMRFGEEVLGAVCVQSYKSEVYGPSQFRLLQTIAAQAAIAVRNAQLYKSEEQANRDRDEFVSVVTHEIKNPLTSIRGYSELAQDAIHRHDEKAAVDAIDVIRAEAKKILRLTEDLLEVSKMEAGKFSMKIENVDLASIVARVAEKYERTSSHDIERDIPRDIPIIDGDATRLSQVVENLVSNAVKYSPDGKPIRVSLESGRTEVLLRIRDYGIGIPEDKQQLIFERFFRVEEGSTQVKGTGLGLFITREIVRMHHGSIRVESAVGEGTTFIVELPIRSPLA